MTTCKAAASAVRLSEIIPPHFYEAHRYIKNHEYTEYVLPGGRGSCKSTFVSEEIPLLMIRNPDMHGLVLRRFGNTLKDSVFNQIIWSIDKLGLASKFKTSLSPMKIVYKPTGQTIFFRGLDDPLKMKSIKPPFGYIGILWFEELDQFEGEAQIRSVEQSAKRGGQKYYIFKSFNPPISAANWANKYALESKPGKIVIKSDYRTVPREWLSEDFIEDAEHLKIKNPRAYEHEYLGIPTGTGGNVFENVIVREVTDEDRKQFDRIYRGIDWGWFPDPFAYNEMYYDSNRCRLLITDEIHCNKKSNRQTADMLFKHGITSADLLIADSAEPKSIGDYRSYGLSCRAVEKGPDTVDYSMKWLQSLNEIIIDSVKCPYTAAEFQEYEYERTKKGEIISGYPDANNHHIDAVRYAMSTVWRKKGR